MSKISPDLFEILNSKSKSYLNKHGGSIMFVFSTILICSWICTYYTMKSHFKHLRTKWKDISCNPIYIPFAGRIMAPEGTDSSDYTINNTKRCADRTLNNIAKDATSGISDTHKIFNESTNILSNNVEDTRKLFSNVRSSMGNIFLEIAGRINNIFIPLRNLMISTREIVNNTLAVCVTSLYVILTGALSINSFVFIFLIVIIIVLLMLIAVIVVSVLAAQASMFIPFIGIFIAIPFIIAAVLGVLLLISALIIGIPAIILCVDIINIIKRSDK